MPNQANEEGGQTETRPNIRGIVVAIPARNEARSIGLTLSSILRSLKDLPASVAIMVCVACDSCVDDTVAEVCHVERNDTTVLVVEGRWQSVGGARRAAVQTGLDAMLAAGICLEQIWVTSTDADTTVGPDWLSRQLRYAQTGLDAVAGVVDLRCDDDLTLSPRRSFATCTRWVVTATLMFMAPTSVYAPTLTWSPGAFQFCRHPKIESSGTHFLLGDTNATLRIGCGCPPALGCTVEWRRASRSRYASANPMSMR
jgi:glycosyltransferase involved in cell wall biosynthesis